jgi:hypothetical protein
MHRVLNTFKPFIVNNRISEFTSGGDQMLFEIASDAPETGSRGAREPSVTPHLETLNLHSVPIPHEQMRKWCLKEGLPVHYTPDGKPSKLPWGKIVSIKRTYPSISKPEWSEIEWDDSKTGWVNDFYLDDYNENYLGETDQPDVVKIEVPTPELGDASQYMMWDGTENPQKKQFNMCGELCAAYIVRNELDQNTTLEAVLRHWQGKPSYSLKDIEEGLDNRQLSRIFALYDELKDQYQIIDNLTSEFPVKGLGRLDWLQKRDALKDKLLTYYLIARVVIDGNGNLIPATGETKHWVVVEEITRNGWGVKLYNPYPNRMQTYSLDEFISSCTTKGLWVKRKQPIREKHESGKVLEVGLDEPKPPAHRPQQYILREQKEKFNLCGEFCAAHILGESVDAVLSYWNSTPPSDLRQFTAILNAYGADKGEHKTFTIGTVLDYWKRILPEDYKSIVGVDGKTGRSKLKTILGLYGYTDACWMDFTAGLQDPFTTSSNTFFASPGKIQKLLKDHFLIAGVAIDKTSGVLVKRETPGAVAHWVVVQKVHPIGKYLHDPSYARNGGWVVLYNPFMNRREEYSYRQFVHSMGFTTMDGLWVRRKVEPAPLATKELERGDEGDSVLNSLPEAVRTWISQQAGTAHAFAKELALILDRAGILSLMDDAIPNKVAMVSKVSPVGLRIEESDPAEKVANVIGRMLAAKAKHEIGSIGQTSPRSFAA